MIVRHPYSSLGSPLRLTSPSRVLFSVLALVSSNDGFWYTAVIAISCPSASASTAIASRMVLLLSLQGYL